MRTTNAHLREATMDLSTGAWRDALGLREGEAPRAVLLEGTWWERNAHALRLPKLEDVRELQFPGWMFGRYHGTDVVYVCAYGAPKAVEPVHVLEQVGVKLAIQIGSCGGLTRQVRTGDMVVPNAAIVGEGASPYYGVHDVALATPRWAQQATQRLAARGYTVVNGPHLTTSALFQQPPATVQAWNAAGYTSVDMETSAVYAAARSFGLDAVSLLYVWDELLDGRGFLATFSDEEVRRQQKANETTFDVALDLVEMIS